MLFTKATGLVLAAAAGFAIEAVAHPYPAQPYHLVARHPDPVPALPAPAVLPPLRRDNSKKNDQSKNNSKDKNNKNKSNNKNNNVVEIIKEDITEVVQGNQTVIIEQIKKTLIKNSNKSKKDDSKRKNSYKKKNKNNATVVLVVQKIIIIEKGGKKGTVYAQSAITANQGQKGTSTVMVTASSDLTANGNSSGIAAATDAGVAQATDATPPLLTGSSSNSTQSVELLGVAPTWTSVDQDPAATLVSILDEEVFAKIN